MTNKVKRILLFLFKGAKRPTEPLVPLDVLQ